MRGWAASGRQHRSQECGPFWLGPGRWFSTVGGWLIRVAVVCVLAAPYPVLATQVPGDSTSEWRQLESPGFVARYQGGDSLRALRALETLEAVRHLPGLSRTDARAMLTVAPTREVMDSLVGGLVPEWAGAVAIPARMEMIVPSGRFWPGSRAEEVRLLRHEWAHLALAHEMGRLRIPRWFNEGYAEWAAGGWLDGGGLNLSLALAFGGAPPLDSITIGWPRERVPAEVAYLLSASVIHYLVESSGTDGLEAFLAAWKESGSFADGMRDVYGGAPEQLEVAWRKWVKRRYGWLMLLSHSVVFWLLLAGALAAMFFVRRRHRREQMARLRAGEPPDAPAFWSVPPGDSEVDGESARR
ncbi:MAG: hypothetical protein OXF01_18155 [Gemmatimonadetes bacterium]|nr:hypothetical protein [Gemmatimonadota bacterium]